VNQGVSALELNQTRRRNFRNLAESRFTIWGYFFARFRRGSGAFSPCSARRIAISANMTMPPRSAALNGHLRRQLPRRQALHRFGKRNDMIARIAQGAQRLAVGKRNRFVEFQGPGHKTLG
jgi:hypothetical protein